MSYTLVSAAVLAFELAYLPAGPTVAQTLLTGLTASTTSLRQLAARATHPDTTPPEVTPHVPYADDECSQQPLELRSLPREFTRDSPPAHIAHALSRSRLGNAAARERLIRTEILGADSAAAASLPPRTRQRAADALVELALPAWAVSTGPLERWPRSNCGPHTEAWTAGGFPNGQLGSSTEHVLQVLQPLADPRYREHSLTAGQADPDAWTHAMHEASWAAHLGDRVRSAATAQFLGVLAFRRAGLGIDAVTSGAWNALSGRLQAAVVSDLLDTRSFDVLHPPSSR